MAVSCTIPSSLQFALSMRSLTKENPVKEEMLFTVLLKKSTHLLAMCTTHHIQMRSRIYFAIIPFPTK